MSVSFGVKFVINLWGSCWIVVKKKCVGLMKSCFGKLFIGILKKLLVFFKKVFFFLFGGF